MIRITEINNTNLLIIKSILDNSGIIIFPTETVWGIGCKFDDENAVKQLYRIKGREFNNPLQIQVSNIEEIKKFSTVNFDSTISSITDEFLPGPLSLVLEKKGVPDFVTSNLSSVAFRFSSCNELTQLIDFLGYPLASTSCNLSGSPVISDKSEIVIFADDNADILFEINTVSANIASTIIEYKNQSVNLIREGYIKYKEIEKRL